MGGGRYHPSDAGMLGVRIRKDMDDLGELEVVVAAYDPLTGYCTTVKNSAHSSSRMNHEP